MGVTWVADGPPGEAPERGGSDAPGARAGRPGGAAQSWQLLVVGALFLLVFGTMTALYVQSLSLPKCGAAHVASPTAVPRPEEIRCRR
jgi:hypothetical protein